MGSKGSKGSKNSRKKENVEAGLPFTRRISTLGNYGLNYNYFPRMRYPFLYFPLPPSNFVSRPSMSYAVMPPSYGGRLVRPPPLPMLQLPRPWYQGYFCQSLPPTWPRQTGFVFNLPPRSATAADYAATQYFGSFVNRYPFSNPFIMLLSNPAAALTPSITSPVTICFPRQQTFPALPSISLPSQTQQYYSQPQLPSIISQTMPSQLALPSSQPVETIIVKRRKRSKRKRAPQQVVVHEKPIIIKERSSSPAYRHTAAPIVQPQIQYIPIPYAVPQQQSTPQTVTTQEVIEEVIPPPQIISEQVPIGYTTSQTLVQPPSQPVVTNSRKFIVIDSENYGDRTIPNYKILDPKDLNQFNEIPSLNSENFTLLNEGLINLQTPQSQLFGVPMQTAQINQPYFTQKPTIVQSAQDADTTEIPNLSQLQAFYNTNNVQALPNENLNQTLRLLQNPVQPPQVLIDSGDSTFRTICPPVAAPTFTSALTSAVSSALNGQINPSLRTTNLTLT